eukprot:1812660-Rhodomonas_salina.1
MARTCEAALKRPPSVLRRVGRRGVALRSLSNLTPSSAVASMQIDTDSGIQAVAETDSSGVRDRQTR